MLSTPARQWRALAYAPTLPGRTPTFSQSRSCLSLYHQTVFKSLTSQAVQIHSFSSKKIDAVPRPEKSLTLVLKDLNQITKFKLGILNTWVTLTTFMMKGGSVCSGECMLLAAATQLMAMSSQTFNQIIETDHDKMMVRTRNRPLPQGKITKEQAWALGTFLYASSNYILYQYMPLSSMFVANSIFFSYIFCYTPMKRRSELNTPVGAVVGSLTSYLGWAAAGGSLLSLDPLLVFMYTFCWQFPHFYGILWTYKDDYKKAGFKMLSDSNKAYNQIKYAIAGQALSVGGLLYSGAIDPISAVITWYMLYKYEKKPAEEFQKDASFQNARRMTILSYGPFTILFAFIYVNLALKTFGYDKKIKEAIGLGTEEKAAIEQ